MDRTLRVMTCRRSEAGVALMDFIFSFSVMLILGSITVHLFNVAYGHYELKKAASIVAGKLEVARGLAKEKGQPTGVIFDFTTNTLGVDENHNGKLESVETEYLHHTVRLSEDSLITFSTAGGPQGAGKLPEVIVGNSRASYTVRVSAQGTIDID